MEIGGGGGGRRTGMTLVKSVQSLLVHVQMTPRPSSIDDGLPKTKLKMWRVDKQNIYFCRVE